MDYKTCAELNELYGRYQIRGVEEKISLLRKLMGVDADGGDPGSLLEELISLEEMYCSGFRDLLAPEPAR